MLSALRNSILSTFIIGAAAEVFEAWTNKSKSAQTDRTREENMFFLSLIPAHSKQACVSDGLTLTSKHRNYLPLSTVSC